MHMPSIQTITTVFRETGREYVSRDRKCSLQAEEFSLKYALTSAGIFITFPPLLNCAEIIY
jgi:hypothetical protein